MYSIFDGDKYCGKIKTITGKITERVLGVVCSFE